MPDPSDIKEYARPRAEAKGLHWLTYEKQIAQESNWRHWSSPGVVKSSPTGSMGLGQLNSRFYPREQWEDPYVNIDTSMAVMAGYVRKLGTYRKALAAYNWGPGNVGGYTENGRVHPAWDGTRAWRCPHESVVAQCRTAQRDHYLDVILGPDWKEPNVSTPPAPTPGPVSPPPSKGAPMPEYRFGFKDLADRLGRHVVGAPTTEEHPFTPDDLTVQYTERGLMMYHKPSNRPYFIPGESTGAIAVGPPPSSVTLVDLRGKLPTRPGTDGQYSKRNLAAVDSIDIHYTASPPTGTVQSIASYQVGPGAQEDFPAIAYHIIVTGDGTANWCHDLDRRVWHNGGSGRNERAIGLCYVGNVEPNDDQKRGLRRAVVWCQEQLGRPLAVAGHRDAPYPTQCPGPTWPGWRIDVLP